MSSSMRPSPTPAEYNPLISYDLSQLDIDVFITDEKGTRKVNLRDEFKHSNALIIAQPGASTVDEAANLKRVNLVVDNGVITSAHVTKTSKDSANEMLCQLAEEQKKESVYQVGSSAMYGVKPPVINTNSATTANPTLMLSPR